MSRKFIVAAALLALLAFFIPIEHKYDKLARFYALTLAPPGLEISPSFEQKFYLYPSDIAALVLLCLSLFWFRTPVKEFFGHPIWIVFLFSFLSIAASPFSSYLIPYSRLLQLATPFILFSVLRTTFNEEEKEKLTRWILVAILFAALFQAGVAIAQYAKQGSVGLRILSESNEFSIFNVQDRTRWIFDSFTDRSQYSIRMIRSQGTMPHANPFGGFMFLSILATYGLILKYPAKKWFFAFILPFLIFAMALSFSRSAIFAWAIASLSWFGILFYREGWKNKEIRFIAKLVIFATLATSIILGKQFLGRGGIVNYNRAAQKSDEGRVFLQASSMKMIQQNPFLGVGYSLFSNESSRYLPPNAPKHVPLTVPHNIFLLIASETGLISLGGLLLTIFLILRNLIRERLTIQRTTLGALFVGFLFIGLCDFYPIFYQQGKLMFFLVMGLLTSNLKRQESYAVITNH